MKWEFGILNCSYWLIEAQFLVDSSLLVVNSPWSVDRRSPLCSRLWWVTSPPILHSSFAFWLVKWSFHWKKDEFIGDKSIFFVQSQLLSLWNSSWLMLFFLLHCLNSRIGRTSQAVFPWIDVGVCGALLACWRRQRKSTLPGSTLVSLGQWWLLLASPEK